MQDCELYRRILGIESPWFVSSVELVATAKEVRVVLAHKPGVEWPCPECGKLCLLHDHQETRRWRHLDTCQFRTILCADPPRSNCPKHGARVVNLPWAEAHSRFTALFEALAIDWLKAASKSAVRELLGLTWDEVDGIMNRAVRRGLSRRAVEPVAKIGFDEKAFRKGQDYLTIVTDLSRGRVLYVAKDREESSLDGFWSTLTAVQKESIQAVAMDMWQPYVNSTLKHLPDAGCKVVYDKFHIVKHLTDGVDQVRRQENKRLRAQGEDVLKGTKYVWLRNPVKMDYPTLDYLEALRSTRLRTARAWAIKESLMSLFEYRDAAAARRYFSWWYNWASHSRLEPMKKPARMLRKRLDNVLTYLRHRITNATTESLNAKIQWIKYTARGFRNWQNFIDAIYFHCGGLDLNPQPL
jgi:transposase